MAWKLYDVVFGPDKEQVSKALLHGTNSVYGESVVFMVVENETETEFDATDWRIKVLSITKFDGGVWNIYGRVNDPGKRFHSHTIHIEYRFGTRSGRITRLGTEILEKKAELPPPKPGVWEIYYWARSNDFWVRLKSRSSESETIEEYKDFKRLLEESVETGPPESKQYAKSMRTYVRYPDGRIEERSDLT